MRTQATTYTVTVPTGGVYVRIFGGNARRRAVYFNVANSCQLAPSDFGATNRGVIRVDVIPQGVMKFNDFGPLLTNELYMAQVNPALPAVDATITEIVVV